jgi:hypothetical protein
MKAVTTYNFVDFFKQLNSGMQGIDKQVQLDADVYVRSKGGTYGDNIGFINPNDALSSYPNSRDGDSAANQFTGEAREFEEGGYKKFRTTIETLPMVKFTENSSISEKDIMYVLHSLVNGEINLTPQQQKYYKNNIEQLLLDEYFNKGAPCNFRKSSLRLFDMSFQNPDVPDYVRTKTNIVAPRKELVELIRDVDANLSQATPQHRSYSSIQQVFEDIKSN